MTVNHSEEVDVSTPGQVAGATQQAAGQTVSTAKDEAGQTASAAKDAVVDVAETAKEQVGQVAGEALNQVRQLTDQAKTQAGEQAANATQKLSESVRSLSSEMRQLSQGSHDGSGTLAGLASQIADRGEKFAEYLAQQGPGGLAQDMRSFAARKPGSFLFAAIAAGVAAGRMVKGATSAEHDDAQKSPYTSSFSSPSIDPYPVAPSPAPYGVGDELGYLDQGTARAGGGYEDDYVADRDFTSAPTYEPGRGL